MVHDDQFIWSGEISKVEISLVFWLIEKKNANIFFSLSQKNINLLLSVYINMDKILKSKFINIA